MSDPIIVDLFKNMDIALDNGDVLKAKACVGSLLHKVHNKMLNINTRKIFAYYADEIQEATCRRGNLCTINSETSKIWASLGISYTKFSPFISEWCFVKSLYLYTGNSEALKGLGELRMWTGDFKGAWHIYFKALRRNGIDANVRFNFALCACKLMKYDIAEPYLREALLSNPHDLCTLVELGVIYHHTGRFTEASTYYRTALALIQSGSVACIYLNRMKIDWVQEYALWSSFLYNIMHNPAYSDNKIHRISRYFGRKIESRHQITSNKSIHSILGRRIKIGYISASFSNVPEGRFFSPLVRFHDKQRFKIYCYSFTGSSDYNTEDIKANTEVWRDLSNRENEEADAIIRRDNIDILIGIDAWGLFAHLQLFARKCAPIQIAIIGYAGTTGLSSMDYFITDSIVCPQGSEKYFSENLYRLPNCFSCFLPPKDAPAIFPLPALKNGFITFGSLHRPIRINSKVIALWSRVLRAIPNSKMLIFHSTLTKESIERHRILFAKNGIDSARVDFQNYIELDDNILERYKYLSVYNFIDIALDTFPWSGHTSSCDALWMGVPHVTLRGNSYVGRMVASVLSNANLKEFIADSHDEFVAIAEKTANDIASLARLRSSMRERLLSSSLCDGPAYTASVEAAYLNIFKERCNQNIIQNPPLQN